jgi:hypothetical protein
VLLSRNLNPDNAIFHPDRVACYAGIFSGRFDHRAIIQTHSPGMQWANHHGARDNAVAQGTAAVWAAVFDSQETVAKIEERDLVAIDFDATALAEGDIFRFRDAYPAGLCAPWFHARGVHTHSATVSIG